MGQIYLPFLVEFFALDFLFILNKLLASLASLDFK